MQSLSHRLQQLERRHGPARQPLVFHVWAPDADTGEMVNQQSGVRLSAADFARLPGRFTLDIARPDAL